MPDSIIRAKIKEALMAAGNNRHDAHKLLITWAVREPALLLAITKPHLKAICAGLVDHHVRSRAEAGGDDGGPDNLPRAAIDDIVASAAVHMPMDNRKSTIPPPKETERQANTMRKLAAAFTKKKK
jgi:hypothetical protein